MTFQGRILKYAQEIGWIFVPRDEAEKKRGFAKTSDEFLRHVVAEIPRGVTPEERAHDCKVKKCIFIPVSYRI